MATWSGWFSAAAVAGPPSPEKPGTPVPAILVTVPPGSAGVQRGGGCVELGDGAFGFTGSCERTPREDA
jgi:hypothetical protein